MEFLADLWNLIIIEPMINSLVLLYSIFLHNFGLAIIVFTLLVRVLLIPLTVRQARQMKQMAQLQPRLKEIQQRYAKDRQRLSQETMKVYREHGVNPIGCLGPLVIQFPIWIGLYQAITQTLRPTPESLVSLSRHLYTWLPQVHEVIPIDSTFLWLDLALPDPLPVLPILVGVSMWLMQKMTTLPAADPRQESTNRMMLWMMPLMFGFFTTTFPSGLALYWVVSNVIGMVIQGFVTGWGPLTSVLSFRRSQGPSAGPSASQERAKAPALVPPAEETVSHASDRDDRQNAGRSSRNRPKGARRRSRGGRNRRR